MIQAPFGTTTPGWPVMTSPVFAWPQATLTQPTMTPPISLSPGGSGPTIAPLPLTTPLVIPDGVTAPALLAAIAMRRGLPQGPANDHDVEELLYDALEFLPGASDVEVRCEGGRVTLTGSVPQKHIKRDVGELAWAIPVIADVQNTITITGRRRSRPFGRENETQPQAGQSRKQS